MLCGSVISVIASLAVAAAVVPAIQPVLPIQLPILLLVQTLDPPSLAPTPPTAPHFFSLAC
ncbi:hypothetical protein ColLi_12149 [Colletotrichum liriopes]|uniref:Secreted peptide n=1 Tax=Colletotrichum liriopes TaxID=708192 RepID=A0AA37GXV0_9PEZI|nr:hypothetical protein ColLi_12149 [Colletotrichum liriopes]